MSNEMELQVVASLLRRGRTLDQLSTGLTVFGALFGVLTTFNLWSLALGATVLILGLLQKYWALRVAFDADLFQLMADDPQHLPQRTQALDQALQNLGLQPAERAERPWAERSRGALKLLRRQAQWLAAQVLVTLAALLASPWLSFAG